MHTAQAMLPFAPRLEQALTMLYMRASSYMISSGREFLGLFRWRSSIASHNLICHIRNPFLVKVSLS